MNIFELPKMSESERTDFLDAHSTEVKDLTYMKPLTNEELNIKRDDLAQAAMQKSVLRKTHPFSSFQLGLPVQVIRHELLGVVFL